MRRLGPSKQCITTRLFRSVLVNGGRGQKSAKFTAPNDPFVWKTLLGISWDLCSRIIVFYEFLIFRPKSR
jgi:hypothetical protein